MSDEPISPRLWIAVILVVAVGAAWLLMMPAGDPGPEVPSATSVAELQASRERPRAMPPAVATRPMEATSREGGNAEAPVRRTGEVPGAKLQRLRERLEGKPRINNPLAAEGAMRTGRSEAVRRKVVAHIEEAPELARMALDRLTQDGTLAEEQTDAAMAAVDRLQSRLDDIGRLLDDGSMTVDEAQLESQRASDRALKEISDQFDGEVGEDLEKALTQPTMQREPPSGGQDVPDDWWEGEPIDWE